MAASAAQTTSADSAGTVMMGLAGMAARVHPGAIAAILAGMSSWKTSGSQFNKSQVCDNMSRQVLVITVFVLVFFIFPIEVFAENLTTNTSGMERRLLGAVPGVDGRIINQEPAGVVAGVEVPETTMSPIKTPAPTTPPPEPPQKAACGPTTLLALAVLPLMLKRKKG